MPSCAGSYLGKVEPEAVHLLLDCSAADNQLQGVSSWLKVLQLKRSQSKVDRMLSLDSAHPIKVSCGVQ